MTCQQIAAVEFQHVQGDTLKYQSCSDRGEGDEKDAFLYD